MKVRWRVLVIGGLVAACCVIYGQTLGYGFVHYDDDEYVTGNRQVQQGPTWGSVSWAFTTGYFNNWHPLTWLSHMIDVRLFGLNAGRHHLVNLLFHIFNTLLLFELLARMTRAPWPSALVAALFAVHPLHVESVAWISERKDVLSAFFGLIALGGYVHYVKRPSILRYGFVAAPFAAALMAKSMMVTWPCVFLLLDYWPLERVRRWEGGKGEKGKAVRIHGWVFLEKVPLFALSIGAGIAALLLRTPASVAASPRATNAVVNYIRYLMKTLWPADLAVCYPLPAGSVGAVQVLGALAVLAAVTALALLWARRRPYFAVGWFWYLVTLTPAVGFVQIGTHGMADRYTYIPLTGVFIMAAWTLSDVARGRASRRIAAAGAVGVVIALVAGAWVQTGYWRDSLALFEHALAVSPNSSVVHNNLGLQLVDKGRTEEALTHYREAVRIDPTDVEALNNLGVLLGKLGQNNDARDAYKEALRVKPDHVPALNNLGNLLAAENQFEKAMALHRRALDAEPNDSRTHYNLGTDLIGLGRPDEAVAHLTESTRLDPDYAPAHSALGDAWMAQGRTDEAIREYGEAIRINPDGAVTHYNLGLALAKQRRIPEAIAQMAEAVRIDPRYVRAQVSLGYFLASQKQWDKAAAHFRAALEIDPNDEDARNGLAKILAVGNVPQVSP